MNGSRATVHRGHTNGRGAHRSGEGPAAARRRRGAKSAAVALAGLVLLPAFAFLLIPGEAPRFAADGDFREWDGVGAIFDIDAQGEAARASDITQVRVAQAQRGLYVYVQAAEPLFAGGPETELRIFADADANASTGYDLGDLGADLMVEAVGSHGALAASGLFSFEVGRAPDDWHGWQSVGRPALAVSEGRAEAAFFGAIQPGAAVSVALSSAQGEDTLDPPATAAGALRVAQSAGGARVIAEGATAVPVLDLSLASVGGARSLAFLRFVPSGATDFRVVSGGRLVLDDGRAAEADVEGGASVALRFAPPIALAEGLTLHAQLEFDFASGKGFSDHAGASFGARVLSAETEERVALLVLRPRVEAPSAYLSFVAAAPVVDGAFGEWRLASALADPSDLDALAGEDLVGLRAVSSGTAGAFFAETRGDILEGARMADLPLLVSLPAPPSTAGSSAGAAPLPNAQLPPLSVDDRVLVYFDADSDPLTGFRPANDLPVGAEFVIEVGGRFSSVVSAHLLAFAGASPFESSWVVRGTLSAAASGSALEGEIPSEVLGLTGNARVLFQTVAWSGRTGDLSDALQDLSLALPDPDHLLHFQSVTFDPLRGAPPVRSGLLSEEPNGFWVVQFNDAPTSSSTGAVTAAGATLFGYVHSNAYLAKMDASTAEVVRAMPEVRWVGIYQPAFKFAADPATWGEGPLSLLALLFERPKGLEDAVAQAGGAVLSATEGSVRVAINGTFVDRLGAIPEIQFVEPENRRVPLNDVGRRLQGVNLTLSRHGLDGSHIVVGTSDTGIDFTHPAFDDSGNSSTGPLLDGRILAYFRYGGAYGDSDGHGTHTAGSIAGDGDLSNTSSPAGDTYQFRGMAPAASLAVMEIIGASPPSDDKVFADQESAGATISSNSWGYVDGQSHGITNYDISAYLTDQSVLDSNTSKAGLQPMTIVFAAGNDGSLGADSVGTPGTAKNVITVGASETDRGYDAYADNASSIAVFSSRGPTDDSRIKPDVVAVGTFVLSTQSRTSGCTCTFGGWDQSWTGANYAFEGGTSQATPQVAGIAALLQQNLNDTYGRIPSPALVRAALINGAEDLGYGYEYTTGVTGPMSQGWGRVNITRSTDGPPGGTLLLYEEGAQVGAGDLLLRRFAVANASTPLKVTLAWSDQPGNPQDTASLAELVNDLDLVVRAPNGTFYHGNQFGGSWSRANNSSFDRLNNVENVFVQAPGVGTWSVEVTGFSVKSAQQRFALAVSGNLTEKAPPTVADAHSVPGAPASARFGWNATAEGSVNGDAYKDLVVGAPGAAGGNGSVYIFFGGASAGFANFNVSLANVTLTGAAAEAFGSSVDSSGDFDGDGVRDLLIGAPSGGKAYLFRGGADWASRTANLTFAGSSADLFGAAVRLAPLDNRTGADALVGAPLGNGTRGAVYLFSGGGATGTWNASAANASFLGNTTGWRLGTSLSAGDADGDGALDLAVGAPGASLVRLMHGGIGASALAFNATLTGLPGSAFGQSVALGGDFNGDGRADVLAGAPLANGSAGAAYVFFGRSPLGDDQVIRHYFFDDMESGTTQFVEMSGETVGATPWSLSTSVYFGGGASGNSWQDSSGNYAASADASLAFKDGVNLSVASNPVLTFVYRADLEETASNYDGFLIKYTTNNGSTWTELDANNTQANYDALGYDPHGPPSGNTPITNLWAFTYDRFVWRKVTFNISSLAGSAAVKFRFQFASDSAVNSDGVYLDDIAVREARPASPNYTVYGEFAGDMLGYSVASLGDASGDGRADFALGAPYAPSGLTTTAGAAYVFTGSSSLNGSVSVSDSAETLSGDTAGANLGWSLTPVAGFNGSTSTLLFAGSPGAFSGAGGAIVGNASALIPEFGVVALPAMALAVVALVARRRRRTTR